MKLLHQFDDGFAAVKVSALGRPELLEALAEIVSTVRRLFSELNVSNSQELSFEEFSHGISQMGVDIDDTTRRDLFNRFDTNQNGTISLNEWTEYLKVEDIHTRPFFTTMQNSAHSPLPQLTKEQLVKFDNLVRRLDTLASSAAKQNVRSHD